jgi:MarR family transcriptional regulator for hemolysin
VADHIGLTLPSMSKLVDGLVARNLVARDLSARDRRRMTLRLTPRGRARLQRARARTRAYLAARLEALDAPAIAALSVALHALGPLFLTTEPRNTGTRQRRNGHS